MDRFNAQKAEQSEQLEIYDATEMPLAGDPLLPFAFDELTCRAIARGGRGPVLHLWRHRRALVLGLRDRRLPGAREAVAALEAAGWKTAVRPSGGAAVPLDEGVVNVSLMLPQPAGAVRLNEDFARMAALIRETVERMAPGARIEAGEVRGAYCPGDFDLSVGGRKFCGIAQRRLSGAFMLQAFVVVEGAGAERARAAAEFYRRAAGRTNGASVPGLLQVTEASAGSLQELTGGASCGDFVRMLKEVAVRGKSAERTGEEMRTAPAEENPADEARPMSAVFYAGEALLAEAERLRERYGIN